MVSAGRPLQCTALEVTPETTIQALRAWRELPISVTQTSVPIPALQLLSPGSHQLCFLNLVCPACKMQIETPISKLAGRVQQNQACADFVNRKELGTGEVVPIIVAWVSYFTHPTHLERVSEGTGHLRNESDWIMAKGKPPVSINQGNQLLTVWLGKGWERMLNHF